MSGQMTKIISRIRKRHIASHGAKLGLRSINYHFRQDGEHRFAYDYETENGGGKVCHGSGGIVPLLAE